MTQLNVFPVREGTKAPAIKDWAHRSRPMWDWQDPLQENPQWLEHKRWGAPCGALNGFWVLDVDPRHGGLESLRLLEEKYGVLRPTKVVKTPSGGFHYYWLWVGACADLTNTAGKLGPGLDIRAEGGMVLVPPTAGYEILTTLEPVLAPDWLLSLLLPPLPGIAAMCGTDAGDGEAPIRNPQRWGGSAVASAIKEITEAPQGQRDATMNRNAYGLGRVVVACNLDPDKVIELLVDAAIAAGYDPAKALDCCNRAVRAGMEKPRAVAAVTAPAVDASHTGSSGDQTVRPEATPLRPCPPKPGPQPADLQSVPGQRWVRMDNEYREWNRDLRTALDARLVVVLYEQSRVLYERIGLRRVALLGTMHQQAGAVKRIGEAAGLLVATGTAVSKVEDYLTTAHPITTSPTLFDTGDGLYRWESPKVEEGPTPTWDTILSRISDPEAFLAHVWSAFEPRFVGRQVLWLQGDGNDGKSILFGAIFEGAGVPFTAVNDDDLMRNNQFLFSSVWDKPCVLIGDSKSVNLMMMGVVHRLTGRDYLGVEYKHGQRFSAKYQGVVWVASNQRPQIEGNRSNTSRLSYLTIKPGAWVDNLASRLRTEVPALLALARRAYEERCPRHFDIALNEESLRLLGESTAADDEKHAATLFAAGLRIEGDDFVARKDIVTRLASSSRGLDDGKMASFYRWLEKQPGVRMVKMEGQRGFKGLKL